MKTLSLLCASLALCAPLSAMADIRWPNLGGKEYCSLRRMGVSHQSALRAAIIEGSDSSYHSPDLVLEDGTVVDSGSTKMASYILNMCPSLFPN